MSDHANSASRKTSYLRSGTTRLNGPIKGEASFTIETMGLQMSNLKVFEFSRPDIQPSVKPVSKPQYNRVQSSSPNYNHNWTDLHYAASRGKVRRIQEIIHKSGTVNLNKKDYYGKTPLYWAAYKGHITCVEELLKFGAKVNTTCCHGDTPLLAVCSIHAQCALLLIKHGADVNHENSWGVTPMYLAACKGQTEVIKYLLEAGAKPTFRKRKTREIPKELLVHSEFCVKLKQLSENPMSLQHTCRSVIRKQLGENPMSKVRSLQIPQKLQDYISLAEIG